MKWVAAVEVSVGIGVMAGWIYAGLPGLRKFRVLARSGEQTSRAPASNLSDRLTRATGSLAPGELLPVMDRRSA
jgi:hypothetical protein